MTAAKISCQNRTNPIWRSEPNQSSQGVEGSEEPAHEAGLEHADARLCPSYNARRLCDSLTREQSRVAVLSRCCFRGSKLQRRVARSGVRLMRKLRGSFPLDAWQKYPAALVGPGGVACYQEGSRLAPGWTAIAWRAFCPRGS
jgi:hypothetical protein